MWSGINSSNCSKEMKPVTLMGIRCLGSPEYVKAPIGLCQGLKAPLNAYVAPYTAMSTTVSRRLHWKFDEIV